MDTEAISLLVQTETGVAAQSILEGSQPRSASEVLDLPSMKVDQFLKKVLEEKIEQVCIVTSCDEAVDIRSVVAQSGDCVQEVLLDDKPRIKHFEAQK